MDSVSEDVHQAINALSRLLLTDEDLDAALQRVAELAVSVIPSCDCCGVSASNSTVTSRVATNEAAQAIDDEQYGTGAGPCVTAVSSGLQVKVDAMGDGRWPAFATRATAEGVRSSLSVPLTIEGAVVGALNLYSRSAVFGKEDEAIALGLAEQAAVTLSNALAFRRMQELVANLQQALASRDVIGQAKGILMERRRITADAAFDVLREVSQRRNVKLRELAQQVAETGSWED